MFYLPIMDIGKIQLLNKDQFKNETMLFALTSFNIQKSSSQHFQTPKLGGKQYKKVLNLGIYIVPMAIIEINLK